ncbi:MAG: glycosyltransferase family 4 protein [Limisphaerales bacterium]
MESESKAPRVLHVVSGLAAQGGVMSFAETAAGLGIEGGDQAIWKHRDFGGRDGLAWVRAGVATATDLGMRHDLVAGLREALALRKWVAGRRRAGEHWVLHAHSRVGALAAVIAGRSLGCPTVVHLHKISGQPWIYRALVRWGRARWAFNSQRTRRHHGIAEGDAVVVYPPVRWPEAPAGDGPGRWFAAGAFVRVKQFDRLIRAVGLLRREGWEKPLEVFGRSDPPVDPAHDSELERLATATPGVHLRGYSSTWGSALRGEDVFVHPADLEAYGIVVLEAFARGCRVVVPPENILGEVAVGEMRTAGGVVVATSTEPGALAAAIRTAEGMAGDAADWWAARREVGARVSVEECVCQLSGLYRSLTGTKRCFRNSSRP